jgi:WD40 repeat protein
MGFTAAGAVALALLVGMIGSAWEAARATRARKDAEDSKRIAQDAQAKESGERKRAEVEKVRAEDNAAQSRQRLVRLHVANGERLVREGDLTGALLWFVEALQEEQENPQAEELHRLRIGFILQQCPRLAQLWFHPQRVWRVDFSPDGSRLATLAGKPLGGGWLPAGTQDISARMLEGEVQIWDTSSGEPVRRGLPDIGVQPELLKSLFSPDGRLIATIRSQTKATGGIESDVRIYDAGSGELAVPVLRFDGLAFHVGFSPDNQRLVVAGAAGVRADAVSGEAQVWNALTGRPASPLLRHEGPVGHAAFSPDGARVVTSSTDRTARIWDANTGQELVRIPGSSSVVYAEFSHDGQRVLVVSRWGKAREHGEVRVYDARTGEPKTPEPMEHGGPLFYALFSPNDRRLLVDSYDNNAYLRDAATGELVAKFKHEHQGGASAGVSFSPDGKYVLTSTAGVAALLWEAETGKRYGPALYHAQRLFDARFSPDGHFIATASDDRTVRLWELTAPETNVLTLHHAQLVKHAEFSRDGGRILTASDDGTARIWDAYTGRPLTPPLTHSNQVLHATFSPNGLFVVTASRDGTARVWDAHTGAPVTPPLVHTGAVFHAEFSPDSRRVVTASSQADTGIAFAAYLGLPSAASINAPRTSGTGEARVWDAATGEPLTPPLRHSNLVGHAAFSPDGRLVVTSSEDRTARVWDSISGKSVLPVLPHTARVVRAVFSPDSHRVLTVADDGARIWDARTGEALTPIFAAGDVAYPIAAFSPDAKTVLTPTTMAALVSDAATGKPVTPPLRHEKVLTHAEFSPNGRFVLTSSFDNSVRLWDAVSGELVVQFLQHENLAWTASFSPDGQRVVSADGNGTVKVWSLRRDPRPVEDLRLLAQLLSARKIDQNGGGLEPIDTLTLSNAWQVLRAKYPHECGAQRQ